MKLTSALLGEHGVLTALFARTEQLLDATPSLDTARATVECLAAVLASHATLENDLLFPNLERRLSHQGPVGVMRREHEQIEMALEDALDAADLSSLIDAAHELIELSRSHFAKEESALFPMAEQVLGEAALTELGQVWARRRQVVV